MKKGKSKGRTKGKVNRKRMKVGKYTRRREKSRIR
jgi:hypothetical protein